MKKFIKGMFTKTSMSLGMALLGLVTYAGFAHAAADADLGTALASTSAMATDNKSQIILFFVAIGLVVLVIAVVKAALNYGIAKIAGSIGGKKRRR